MIPAKLDGLIVEMTAPSTRDARALRRWTAGVIAGEYQRTLLVLEGRAGTGKQLFLKALGQLTQVERFDPATRGLHLAMPGVAVFTAAPAELDDLYKLAGPHGQFVVARDNGVVMKRKQSLMVVSRGIPQAFPPWLQRLHLRPERRLSAEWYAIEDWR